MSVHIFRSVYYNLKHEIIRSLAGDESGSFIAVEKQEPLRYVRISSSQDFAAVQVAITIDHEFRPSIQVHNIVIDSDNDFWDNLPRIVKCADDFKRILGKLDRYKVCAGNFEDHFQHLLLEGVPSVKVGGASAYNGYKEGDFGECNGSTRVKSTIRSMQCALLHKDGPRCQGCYKHRTTLNGMLRREQNRKSLTSQEIISSTKPIKYMSDEEISFKIKSLQEARKNLMASNETLAHQKLKLERKINDRIRCQGVQLGEKDTDDVRKILESHKENEQFNDYEKLFMQQQLKYNTLRDKRGMRWHPTIVKWCIYLKAKSSKAYKTLRESKFVHLPSERTLFDYTHYVKGSIC